MWARWRRAALASGAGLLAGAASACTPVPWDTVGGIAQLPPEVQTLLRNGAAIADPGWPFNAGDFIDFSLPMRRLRLAVVGSDCVRADVEQSGRATQRYALLYQLIDGRWRQVGMERSFAYEDARWFQQKSLGGAGYP